MPSALICLTCWERSTQALIELPRLYHDLLTPTRATRSSGRVSGSTEPAMALADGARWSREWIHGVLAHWARVLSLPPPTGRALSRLDGDEPSATAARVLRHADWLVAHAEHADQMVHDLGAVYADAVKTAYPTGPPGVLLGPCPHPVPRPTSEDPEAVDRCGAPVRAYQRTDLIQCHGCGAVADPMQWASWIVDPLEAGEEAVADAYSLAAWLSVEFFRPIHAGSIKKWASPGTVAAGQLPRATIAGPDQDDDGAPTVRIRRDQHSGRTLYSVRATREYAVKLYGRPPVLLPA